MAARTGCCGPYIYTTRKYNSDGSVVWSQNYQQGGTFDGGQTSGTCLAFDSTQAYCGHKRVTLGSVSWAITAMDIGTGAINWVYDFGSGKAPVQLRINPITGYVVCLMRQPNVASTTETFITLDTTGALVSTQTFTTSGYSYQATDFDINSAGDFHITSLAGLYVWLDPQTSAPTFHVATQGNEPSSVNALNTYYLSSGIGYCITIDNDTDYIGWQGDSSTLAGIQSFYIACQRSKVGSAADSPGSMDLAFPLNFNISPATPTNPPFGSATAITPTGTIQATAAPLSANTSYGINAGINGGIILPAVATEGDWIPIYNNSVTYNNPILYPPVGSSLLAFGGYDVGLNNGVNLFMFVNSIMQYQVYCTATGTGPSDPAKWMYMVWGSSIHPSQYLAVAQLDVCNNGDILTVPLDSSMNLKKFSKNGTLQWAKGSTASGYNVPNGVCTDRTTYCYTNAVDGSQTVAKRALSDGSYVWGHRNLTARGKSIIKYDAADDTAIVNGEPKSSATDAFYLPEGTPTITPVTRTYSTAGTFTDTPPAGWVSCRVECWGGGAGSIDDPVAQGNASCSGGGGAYTRKNSVAVAGGDFTVVVGAGGARETGNTGSTISGHGGGDTSVDFGGVTVCLAKGGDPPIAGNSSLGGTAGAGGQASSGVGDFKYNGGNGINVLTSTLGAAGGSSAAYGSNGTNATGQAATAAPTGGGNGGAGAPTRNGNGSAGSAPGGAAGSPSNGVTSGGQGAAGADGQVILYYT